MGRTITSPVELGFSEFVAKLISDTFDAVITSTISQEESWEKLNQLLALEPDEFADQVISNEAVDQELNRLFPDENGGTLIISGTPYKRANVRSGTQESPPIKSLTGYQPASRVITDKDINAIRSIVKVRLAESQYQMLSTVFAKGKTKVVVDAGKINAKLNFNILQVEESDEPEDTSSNNESTSTNKIFSKYRTPLYSTLSKPLELKNVLFFVKPPTDSDPQTHQVKANVYGEVEIQFKTIS